MKILEGLGMLYILSASGVITIAIKGTFFLKPNWEQSQKNKFWVIVIAASIVTGLYSRLIGLLYEYKIEEIILSVIIIWFSAVVFYFLMSTWFLEWLKTGVQNFFSKFTLK